MKKTLFLAFAAMLALPAFAEMQERSCSGGCGKTVWVDMNRPGNLPDGWVYYNNRTNIHTFGDFKSVIELSNMNEGWFCSKQDCRQILNSWINKADNAEKRVATERTQNLNDQKKLALLCRNFAMKLKELENRQDAADAQIRLMQQIIKQYNAEKVWITFVACANPDAIKYFWPSPTNKSVYQKSKAIRKQHYSSKSKNNIHAGAEVLANLMKLRDGVIKGEEVQMATKTMPAAFALGLTPDKDIRYVEPQSFSREIIGTLFEYHRIELLEYMIQQCGGFSSEIKDVIIKRMAQMAWNIEGERYELEKMLAEQQTALAKAEDADDKKDIENRIAKIKEYNANLHVIYSQTFINKLFADLTPFAFMETMQTAGKYMSYAYLEEIKVLGSMVQAQKAQGQVDAQNIQKLMIVKEKIDIVPEKAKPIIDHALYLAIKNKNGETLKWYNWRKNIEKTPKWDVGLQDPWLPMFVTGGNTSKIYDYARKCIENVPDNKSNQLFAEITSDQNQHLYAKKANAVEWQWKYGVAFKEKPGYISDGTYLSWKWRAGTPHPTRFGYFATDKEGEFVWKAGIPHPSFPEIYTSSTEKQWKLVVGYKQNADGTVIWMKGTKHPSKKGLIASKQSGKWIPLPGYTLRSNGSCIWTPGHPDTQKIGRYAANKEGEWELFDGFADNGKGEIAWTPGTVHKKNNHVVAGVRRFQWVPAEGYQWADPDKEDDFQVIKK